MKPKKLLFSIRKKDFEVQTFRSGGKGGQHQNKTDSGVRIIHKESKAVGESRNYRSQLQNKKEAFDRLINSVKFKLWLSKRVQEINSGKTIEERVEEQCKEENLLIEVRDDKGNWSKQLRETA